MDQITITLPEEMKGYIEGQVAGGKYATASDFFCDLIRQEQQREAKRVVEGMLLESIESGPPVPLGAEDFEAMRAELRERSAKRAVEGMVLEGLRSGTPTPWTQKDAEDILGNLEK